MIRFKDRKLVDSLKGVFVLTVDVEGQIETTKKLIDSLLKKSLSL